MSNEPKKRERKTKAQKLLEQLGAGKRLSRPHMSELSQSIVGVFGGAEGIANELLKLYALCERSPNQQVRVMGMIVDLVKNDTQMSGKQTGFDETSDEDLLAEAEEILDATEDDDGQEEE